MFSAHTQMAKAAVCEVDSAITVKLQMGIPGGHVSFFFFSNNNPTSCLYGSLGFIEQFLKH